MKKVTPPIFTTLADPRASLSSFGHLIQDTCKLARALQSLEINSVTKRCNRAAYTLAVEENNQKAHVSGGIKVILIIKVLREWLSLVLC